VIIVTCAIGWYIERKLFNASQVYSFYKQKNLYFHHESTFRQKDFDVVLSYYAENPASVARYISYLRNISTLRKLDLRIIVYNKNSKVNNTSLKEVLKADHIHLLPNIGREGATYLNHIIENYDTVANHTLFSQAGVEGITNTGLVKWYSDRLENQFNISVGYMPLVSNDMISKYDCGFHQSGNYRRLVELWGMLEQTLCPPGGQAVSKNKY
jgi:hypothetical protein